MSIREAQKNYLVTLVEWRKKRAIEEENRRKQAFNVRLVDAVSAMVLAAHQTSRSKACSKKRKLLLFSKQRKKKLKQQVFLKIEKPIPPSETREASEKFYLFNFNYFCHRENVILKEATPFVNFSKKHQTLQKHLENNKLFKICNQ